MRSREIAYPSIQPIATALLATLPGDDRAAAVAAALDPMTTLEGRAVFSEAMEARFLLWKATGDRAHLAEAKRRLDFLVEHAPIQYRESMVANAAASAGIA